MEKVALSDRFISSPARRPKAGRADYPDALVPGLALRVTEADHRSFVLIARYPSNPKNPTRRALGDHGEITLEQARQKARDWLAMIQGGIDPKVDEARQRAAALRQQSNTFASVGAAFLERHGSKLAKHAEAKRCIDGFAKQWGPRPVTDIQPEECAAAIRAIVKRGAPYEAHNRLGHLRRMYSWAIGTHEFGVTSSPVAALRPADLIGKREARQRVLTDEELRAVWQATDGVVGTEALTAARARDPQRQKPTTLGYPYGPLVRLLILTGQRQREVADMAWSEIDFDRALWTIPAKRMKGARAHEVPLAPDALALLQSLPRFTRGDFVFTTTVGVKSVNGFSKAKERLDTLSGVQDWVFHDLRRTARTHFSALPVQDMVRELVIAHARPGLHAVYDQHSYTDEKRECLRLWEQRLRGILSPKPPAEVADLGVARQRRALVVGD